ncbi:hypothetical protein DMENIID0001_123700 [Sergentomyia squamirostris]
MWYLSTLVIFVFAGVCQCWSPTSQAHNLVDFHPKYVGECGQIYVTDKVVIESPGYPKKYPSNIHCEYILWSPCSTNFHIQFLEFDLEASHLCHKDQLVVSRADEAEDVHLCGRVAGVTTYNSHQGVIKLNFIADNAIEYKGFRLLITRDQCASGSVNRTTSLSGNFATVTQPQTGWSSLRDEQHGITIQYHDVESSLPAFKFFVNTDALEEINPENVEVYNRGSGEEHPVHCINHNHHHVEKSWYYPPQSTIVPITTNTAIVGASINVSDSATRQDSSSHLPQQFPFPQTPIPIYPQTFPPLFVPPNCCRSSPLNRPRFIISSPSFPQRIVNNFDCVYFIERLITSCRLRIIFRYFHIPDVDPNFCINTFVEIDGRRFCGCRSGVVYLSQWGPENLKTIRFRHSPVPVPTTVTQGFIMEVIQEECPYRLLRSLNNSTQPTAKLDFRPVQKPPNTDLNHVNGENLPVDEEKKETEDYEPSMKFFFPNTANRCYFGWLQWFQLTINPLWITRPQCRG